MLVTWGNILLSVSYKSNQNPSPWMWVRSINIQNFFRIVLLDSVVELVFKGKKVEINKDIDFNKIVGALEELLTPKWPVRSFCIVARRECTTYVYQFYKGRPLPINPPIRKLNLDLHTSDVYKYLRQ